jgi:hypothetical protein
MKVGGEKEESGSPWAPNRSGDARRRAELRRGILRQPGGDSAGDQRAKVEEAEGIYMLDSLLELLPGNGRNQEE